MIQGKFKVAVPDILLHRYHSPREQNLFTHAGKSYLLFWTKQKCPSLMHTNFKGLEFLLFLLLLLFHVSPGLCSIPLAFYQSDTQKAVICLALLVKGDLVLWLLFVEYCTCWVSCSKIKQQWLECKCLSQRKPPPPLCTIPYQKRKTNKSAFGGGNTLKCLFS